MKTMIKASSALVAAMLFGACNTAQPTPPCAVGHGGFGAVYTRTSGDTAGSCVRTGDIIGVQKYRQTDGTEDIYLKVEGIAYNEYGLLGNETTALASGTLVGSHPNADGFCAVDGELSPATGIPNSAALTPSAADDVELTYTFSNVEFYVAGSVAGTQFNADLTITGSDGCSASYRVNAMYPVVFCNAHDANGVYLSSGDVAACGETDHIFSGYAANPAFESQCIKYGNPAETGEDYDYGIIGSPEDGQPYVDWYICAPAREVPSLKEGRN